VQEANSSPQTQGTLLNAATHSWIRYQASLDAPERAETQRRLALEITSRYEEPTGKLEVSQ